jgi:hypothetical protein
MGLQGRYVLILGDIVTLALVTVVGFASHHELGSAGWRMLTTFLPLVIAWLAIAPHLRLFEVDSVRDARQLWRPVWGMILAGPLAAWLRGLWLKAPILPVFVLVLSGISALALLAWRILFRIWLRGIFHG